MAAPISAPLSTAGGTFTARQAVRRQLRCGLVLVDDVMSAPGAGTIPGECLNVSDGGLYAVLPLGYGVTVGQRYTCRLTIPERGPEPGPVQLVSQQGMVLRTELLAGGGEDEDRLGVAIRLIGHRSGVMPLPTA
jgi:hypothetical protein